VTSFGSATLTTVLSSTIMKTPMMSAIKGTMTVRIPTGTSPHASSCAARGTR